MGARVLITVARSPVPGHMQSGWAHGLYWRIVNTFGTEDREYCVYLMVLAPTAPLGLVADPDNDATFYVEGITAPHVPAHGDIDVRLTDAVDSELSPRLSMQWVESHYGSFYMPAPGRMDRTSTCFRWSTQQKFRNISVPIAATTFLRRMQPSVEYLCKMLQEKITAWRHDAAATGELHAD